MWTDAENKAAKTLIAHLTSAPVLALPDFDKHFFLTTDASAAAVGVVLSQCGCGPGESGLHQARVICRLSYSQAIDFGFCEEGCEDLTFRRCRRGVG